MKKLDVIGIIIISIVLFHSILYGTYRSAPLEFQFLIIYLPIGTGIGILIVPRIAKRKRKSNLEKRKNNQSAQTPKDSQNTDRLSTSPDSENDRKCRVCGTNISSNVKTCPGCGDIYS